jgi:hypothetical protein
VLKAKDCSDWYSAAPTRYNKSMNDVHNVKKPNAGTDSSTRCTCEQISMIMKFCDSDENTGHSNDVTGMFCHSLLA